MFCVFNLETVYHKALESVNGDPRKVTKEVFIDTLYREKKWDIGFPIGPFERETCNQGMQYVC